MKSLSSVIIVSLAFAGGSVGAPFGVGRRTTACAEVSTLYDDAVSRNATRDFSVKPTLIYECFNSIPVDLERDLAFVDWLAAHVPLLSTIAILPHPPEGYLYPGVDIPRGLVQIAESLQARKYSSQYEFILDLHRLLNVKPHESHMHYDLGLVSLARPIQPVQFVSVSEDGRTPPKVYIYSDYKAGYEQGYTPSDVLKVETLPVTAYLERRATNGAPNHDPDAGYNSILSGIALQAMRLDEAGTVLEHEPLADTTHLQLANGSTITIQNYAYVLGNFSGISSGEEVHARFEIPNPNGLPPRPPYDGSMLGFLPELKGYPEPFVAHLTKYIHGHHPAFDTPELDDVAVLVINGFMTTAPTLMPDFTGTTDRNELLRVTKDFIEASRAAGRKRLVLDLQSNTGGWVGSVTHLYTTLFPGEVPWLGSRSRALPILDFIGNSLEAEGEITQIIPFGTAEIIDANFENFTSFAAMFSPTTILGENFTQIFLPHDFKEAVDSPLFPELTPWFTPEDTVIITDGNCHSACAMTVGLLARDLGIQVVAVGGRPLEAPMQGIGGTKGGGVSAFDSLGYMYRKTRRQNLPEGLDVTQYEMPKPPLGLESYVVNFVNDENLHSRADPAGIPVQFAYEAAHCKLFYTREMIFRAEKLWEAVAEVKWNDGKCVKGSTSRGDDKMGSTAPGLTPAVRSKASWISGPGDV